MRSWKRWFVTWLVLWVGSAVLLVTVLPGQETGKSPAKGQKSPTTSMGGDSPAQPQAEPPAGGVGTGLEMGTGTGLRPMSPGHAELPRQGLSPLPGPGGMLPRMYQGMMSGPMMGSSSDPLAQEVLVAQGQVDQALARYQQTEDKTKRQAIKADLTKALQRQFEVQQQRRTNELAEIESRVQKLRELIEKRNQAQQTIVSKRCDQLLSEIDGLGWTSPSEGAPPPGGMMPGMGGFPGGMGTPGMAPGGMPGADMMPGTGSGMGTPGMMPGGMPGADMMPGTGSGMGSGSEAARRSQSSNNMKQIALAFHNYHDVHKGCPAQASVDKNGKPLLSWRVHILPFLEQKNLYDQFHLDEPWDSEHNQKLIPSMPAFYRNPSGAAPLGKAHYLGVAGKGLFFDGSEGRKIASIMDGTSNTIMTVEVNDDQAVTWTQPDDWRCDPSRPLAGVGRAHPGGFMAGFADGSVRFIAQAIDPQVFYKLLTVAGWEAVNP